VDELFCSHSHELSFLHVFLSLFYLFIQLALVHFLFQFLHMSFNLGLF
jgi:hypothetical protein